MSKLADTSNGSTELVNWRNAERSRLLISSTGMSMVFGQRLKPRQKRFVLTWKKRLLLLKLRLKKSFDAGNQEPTESNGTPSSHCSNGNGGDKSAFGGEKQQGQQQQQQQQPESDDNVKTLFGKVKDGFYSISPKVSLAFHRVKEAKPIDLVKKSYGIVKDELKGNPNRRKRLEYDASSAPSSSNFERSTQTDIVVLPSKQSPWSKKWEAFKNKMRGHPRFKRVSGISEPVLKRARRLQKICGRDRRLMIIQLFTKSKILVRLFWENQMLPCHLRDSPQRPGDADVLKKYCTSRVIERCVAERKAFESQGIFFDNKILHISEVEVRETKKMGGTPIISVVDTIQTVYYAWAMQQLDADLGDGYAAPYSIWKLREMHQLGVRALI